MGVFKIYDTVTTTYGYGFIKEIREQPNGRHDYVVTLTNWVLAQGQSPTLYLQEESLISIPGCFPGSTVATPFGHAQIKKILADGTHIAEPMAAKLSDGTCPFLNLKPGEVKLHHTPGIEAGDEVVTVYGQGYVQEHRKDAVNGQLVVKLRNWHLAQGQSPTLYLHPDACVKVPGLDVGAKVKTVFGMVQVLENRRDGTHVCRALHWSLADGKPPILFLAPEAFSLLSLKP